MPIHGREDGGKVIAPGNMSFHLLDPQTNGIDQKVNEHIVLHGEFKGTKKAELFSNDAKGRSQKVKEGTWEGAGSVPRQATSISWDNAGDSGTAAVEQISVSDSMIMTYQGKQYDMMSSAGPERLE